MTLHISWKHKRFTPLPDPQAFWLGWHALHAWREVPAGNQMLACLDLPTKQVGDQHVNLHLWVLHRLLPLADILPKLKMEGLAKMLERKI